MRSSSGSSPEALPRAAAVIVAGGSGRRMAEAAGGARKQYLPLLGEPVLRRAILPFLEHPAVEWTVVVLPPDDAERPPPWLAELAVTLVPGGEERGDSVWNGLQAVPEGIEAVLVHDGARPLVSRALIDRVLREAAHGAAVPAVPVVDTVKEAGEDRVVRRTLDRSLLWRAQTPQGFPRETLLEVHRRARAEGWRGTDDASLCERYGHPVRLVAGEEENLKITGPLDLVVAEALARALRDR